MLRLATMQDLTRICGLICINQTEPAVYADANWTLAEKALVLHRMAVDPALRGRGTGSELLQQAETLALSLGLRYLKTDTYALNEKAQQLFLKHGYHFCGEIQFRKMEHQFYCYEKGCVFTYKAGSSTPLALKALALSMQVPHSPHGLSPPS